MKVSLAYATKDIQIWRNLDIPDNSTVEDVINESGILDECAINLKTQKVGIYGKFAKLQGKVSEGDRIEIYEPIIRVLDEEEDDDD